MAEITLICVDQEHATAVYNEAHRPGDRRHDVRQDGKRIVITYDDKRYPLDVADWAGEHGHAHDDDAARVIARL